MKTPEMLTRMVDMLEFAYRHPDCPTRFEASGWPVFTQWVADHKDDRSPFEAEARIEELGQTKDRIFAENANLYRRVAELERNYRLAHKYGGCERGNCKLDGWKCPSQEQESGDG